MDKIKYFMYCDIQIKVLHDNLDYSWNYNIDPQKQPNCLSRPDY